MSLLWPRLDAAVSMALFRELRTLGMEELSSRATTSHPAQTFASTGGARATPTTLQGLRDAIVATAQQFGFPNEGAGLVAFDRALAPVVRELMPMTVGEALTRGVWSFLSLVLAPDVTCWRFGIRNEERWVCRDRTRHMYSRLWWQADILGGDGGVLEQLSESELNQLLERTTIGGCKPLVRAFASAIVHLAPEARQRNTVREASLRLLRMTAVIDPWSLDDHHLDRLVQEALQEAMQVTAGEGGFAPPSGTPRSTP